MNKLVATLSFFVALLGSTAYAADDQQSTQGSDPAQQEQELVAALKKCDSLTGAEKQKCIEAAKKKFGQM